MLPSLLKTRLVHANTAVAFAFSPETDFKKQKSQARQHTTNAEVPEKQEKRGGEGGGMMYRSFASYVILGGTAVGNPTTVCWSGPTFYFCCCQASLKRRKNKQTTRYTQAHSRGRVARHQAAIDINREKR